MAQPGERIANPITGERIVFYRLPQSSGDRLRFTVELRPGGVIAGAPHHHPHEERFRVLQGRLAGWIAGQGAFSRGAGETLVVPSGVDHIVLNPTLRTSKAEVEAVPGRDFARLLESSFDVARGRLSRVGDTARLMRDERVRITGVPDSWQERLMSALSSVGSRGPAV